MRRQFSYSEIGVVTPFSFLRNNESFMLENNDITVLTKVEPFTLTEGEVNARYWVGTTAYYVYIPPETPIIMVK